MLGSVNFGYEGGADRPTDESQKISEPATRQMRKRSKSASLVCPRSDPVKSSEQ